MLIGIYYKIIRKQIVYSKVGQIKRICPITSIWEYKAVKNKYAYEKMEIDDTILAVPIGENAEDLHAVITVNEEAMRILELLKEETTKEIIVAQLLKEYLGEKEEIESLVSTFIEQLRQEGLLEE